MNQNPPNPQGAGQYGNGAPPSQRPNPGNGWNNNQSSFNNNSVSSANTVSTVPQNGQNMNQKGSQLVPPGQQGMAGGNQMNQNPQNQWGQQGAPNQSQMGPTGPGQQPQQWNQQGSGMNPQQQPGQWSNGNNQQKSTVYQGPVAQGNGKQLKRGEKKSEPGLAFTTEFSKACKNAPKSNTRDRNIIHWDHDHENFVYGEQEYDFKGRLTKKDINAAVSSLSGDASWNPTKQCENCVLGYFMWIAIVVTVVIIIVAGYSTETGTQNFTWVVYAAGGIAIVFGGILALCCREMANRLSWRKRLLMFGVLDRLEQTNLSGTDMGIRSGKEGAWIEYGLKNSLDKFRPWYIPVAQNQPSTVVVTPPPQQNPQPNPPVQQSQFVPAKTETTQSNFAPVRTEQTNSQQSRWVEMTNQPVQNESGYRAPAQAVRG